MKEAYYFSHDSNARHDPKILGMRGVYGSEGYGWYWILVEMMRDADSYKLDMQAKYSFNAYAKQMDTDCTTAKGFIDDCIHEFGLFETDGVSFWSVSLLRRMDKREKVNAAKKKAAEARWGKGKSSAGNSPDNAESMHMHSECSTDGMQGKESKGKESKENKNIKPLCDVPPSAEPTAGNYDPDFERFWKVFPATRKKDKSKSYGIWKKKIQPSEREALIRCTVLYANDLKTIGLHSEFAKMPATYLNAGTYKDYLQGGEDIGHQGVESSGRGQASFAEYDDYGPPPPEQPNYYGTYYEHAGANGAVGSGGVREEAPSDDDLFVRR
ncbi:DUF4373 domain-containing protein [Paenibacillus sp. CN-4]|uniref:DUF4373 domain-containing protein n=1 Tax=Paenibacillus nanchangensis TaxID=3348343 RepID=UPI00397C4284